MFRKGFSIVAALALVALAVPRLVGAQSLGDLAKKEEERRKEIKQPSKVLTNKDLTAPPGSSAPPPATPAPAASPAADAKDKDKDKEKDAEPPKDQAYWSGRLKQLQQQLDRDQTFADALQTKLNSQNTDFVNRDDPAQRSVIERDRQKTLAEMNRLKTDIEKDKKAIADLQEEARKAGVPPGWLR